jgi:lysozyme family protein
VFDSSVQHGNGTAGKMLQEAINDNTGANLKVDGVIGPQTIDALNSIQDATTKQSILDNIAASRENNHMTAIGLVCIART